MGRVQMQISATDEFKEAVAEFCDKNDINFSQETRSFWAKKMKRPELAGAQSVGRPRKKTDRKQRRL